MGALVPAPEARLAARQPRSRPPLLTVGWHDALFEHFRIVDEAAVARLLPPGLALDRREGAAYLSVVSFRMAAMRWRGLLLPLSHTYPQINVRVYVHCDSVPGVFFLRNFVSHRLAAWAGRAMYGMPYVYQPVQLVAEGERFRCAAALPGGQHCVAGTAGERIAGHEDDPASLQFFLVERYPLYSVRRGQLWRAHMHHPPWPLRALVGAERSWAVPEALGLRGALERLDGVQCSPGVDVQMWGPRRVG